MPDRWLSIEQLQDSTEWSDRTVQQKVKDGALRSRSTRQRSRNGRRIKEYDLFSLPPGIQAKHATSTLAAIVPAEESHSPSSASNLILFAPKNPPASAPRLPVTDEHRDQINERVAIISPLIEFLKSQSKPDRKEWCKRNNFLFGNSDAIALQIAQGHGIGKSTLWKWMKIFRDHGPGQLFDKARSDKGVSKWFAKYPQAAELVAFKFLEERQSVRCSWEALVRDAARLGIPDDDLPSYETVRVALQSIPPSWAMLAREGKKKYREQCAPYVSRAYSEASNLVWVSDHCIFDVEVTNDCIQEQPFGAPIRLRLTAILDFRSRYVVGYSFAWEGSSRSIGTALRHAILEHGPCELFYCDNGKDYLKVAKGAAPGYLRESGLAPENWYDQELTNLDQLGILARCNIAVTHCIVRHPQSKHVERFFRTMHERFDRKWWTYTGGSPDRRPDLTEAAMAEHRKLLRHGEVDRSQHPRATMFMAAFQNWLNEYHNNEHRGRGMDGRTPVQVFAEERNPNQRGTPPEDELATTLLARETRVVQECAIRLGKRRYVHFDAKSLEIMHRLNRTEVVVGYDENDPDAVVILDGDGTLLTWLKAETFLPQSSSAGPAIAASMQERRHLEKQTRTTLRSITLGARTSGAKSEVEHLVQNTPWQLPIAVNDFITHSKPANRPDLNAKAPPTATEIAANFWED
jgi:putative transposase